MNRTFYLNIFFFMAVTACILISPGTAATGNLHIVKYASDRTTVINETTLTWQWMQANLPVLGDGTTHYYHQGPVFVEQEDLRLNPAEDTNVQEKDYGAVKGTNLKDLCNVVGGLSPGEEVTLKAIDGLSKNFAYRNVYSYPSRQGPMVITWFKDGTTPDTGYDEGMKLVFFADTSQNPFGIHAFGNNDWHESADSQYWYYYYQGTKKYPTTTGLSVKYITDVIIYSSTPASAVQPPVTAFSATPVSGTAPLTAQFSDLSTGSPISWAWDFTGDGSVDSTQQNPLYTFSTPGTYTVKLTATNSYGSTSETKSGYIRISAPTVSPPVAMFSASPVSGPSPLTVQFSDHSTGSPVSWSWDFTSDGVIDSSASSPSFTYTGSGNYTVTMTTRNATGTPAQNSTTIQVSNQGPTAGFSSDVTTGSSPLVVQFTDSSTGAGLTMWAWDFNNDGVIDSTEKNPRFTYAVAGIYPVNLTVSGPSGTSSVVKTQYIRVTTTQSVGTIVSQTPAQEPAIVTKAPTTVTTQLRQTTAKISRATVTTSPPTAAATPESPGPAPVILVGTLAICGLGTALLRRYH
jgi:PKD repeat protein